MIIIDIIPLFIKTIPYFYCCLHIGHKRLEAKLFISLQDKPYPEKTVLFKLYFHNIKIVQAKVVLTLIVDISAPLATNYF